ncbi:hypothetical protein [Salibacterium qingdaonense]|uniref:Uncharacterized protein n=1 Tax=Salibacterium qingdaonense TaxID=266892 RepID=A0A1I4M7N1_9BACI|nr:hypothetical protein [Salibacterium qingdaonense]SFL99156.1 hypothetical protein SAMN04488054_11088 [Salibacterium qingdaonense]
MALELVLLSLFIVCVFLFLLVLWRKIKKLEQCQTKMARRLESMQKLFKDKELEQEKEEVRHHLHMKALDIRNTVYKQTKGPHPQAVHHTPQSSGYTDEYLKILFGPERAGNIIHLFLSYQTYVKTYWETEKGRIRTVFRKDTSNNGIGEVEDIQAASRDLLEQLDDTLHHFH